MVKCFIKKIRYLLLETCVLGVSRNANLEDIKSAYRKIALKYHPDRLKTVEEKKTGAKVFGEAASAYEILSDTEKRKNYDQFGEVPTSSSASTDSKNSTRSYDDVWSGFFGRYGYSRFWDEEKVEPPPGIINFTTREQVIDFLNQPIPKYSKSKESVEYLKAYVNLFLKL